MRMLNPQTLNQFKQQLLIATGRYTIHEMVNIFGNTRHIIEFDTPENLVSILREYIPPNITIGIHCTLEDLYKIQIHLKKISRINSYIQKYSSRM